MAKKMNAGLKAIMAKRKAGTKKVKVVKKTKKVSKK